MGTEAVWIPLVIAAASAGASTYNTVKTNKRQDQQLASTIRNQSSKQREQEARINDETKKLSESTSADERAKKLEAYTAALRKNQGNITAGFNGVGGETFQKDAAAAAQDVMSEGMGTADLMSRIDAPVDQRRGEGVSFGNLGVDLDNTAREAQGQNFLDQIRLQGIKRNPWIDAAADFGMAYAGGKVGGTGTASKFGMKIPKTGATSVWDLAQNIPTKW
jgi:hypothetical protein